MTGLALAPESVALVTVLSALALFLFLLASWLGRWPVWLGGFAAALLALCAAFFFRAPPRDEARGPASDLSPPVHTRRSPVDGVMGPVDHGPDSAVRPTMTPSAEGDPVDQVERMVPTGAGGS